MRASPAEDKEVRHEIRIVYHVGRANCFVPLAAPPLVPKAVATALYERGTDPSGPQFGCEAMATQTDTTRSTNRAKWGRWTPSIFAGLALGRTSLRRSNGLHHLVQTDRLRSVRAPRSKHRLELGALPRSRE